MKIKTYNGLLRFRFSSMIRKLICRSDIPFALSAWSGVLLASKFGSSQNYTHNPEGRIEANTEQMSWLKYILTTCPLQMSGLDGATQNLENIGKSDPLTNDLEQISVNTNVSAMDNKLQVRVGSIEIISL